MYIPYFFLKLSMLIIYIILAIDEVYAKSKRDGECLQQLSDKFFDKIPSLYNPKMQLSMP